MDSEQINILNQKFRNSSALEILAYFLNSYKNSIAFATSLGAEDQVILQLLSKLKLDIKIFTLDTGRMFPETYDLMDKSQSRFKIPIEIYFPDASEVENMVKEKGVNLFYDSIENRKLCCNIRKIRPLKRALTGIDAWITGMRRSQSPTRTDINIVEWDELNGLIKVNPLLNWGDTEMWDYIKANNIPYNPLHDQGFLSIGCQPCTRAVMEGEDSRAGRWWWEQPETRECGLHQK